MIFVTVGTHEQPFNRLIEKMDYLVKSGAVREKVIAQIGYCTYTPKCIEYFRFTDFEKMDRFFDKANFLITHGGIGSLLLALKKNKKIIAVPRMKKYNEHTNDHQVQIVKELENQKRIVAVYDIDDLLYAIKKIKNTSFNYRPESDATVITKIRDILAKWEKNLT